MLLWVSFFFFSSNSTLVNNETKSKTSKQTNKYLYKHVLNSYIHVRALHFLTLLVTELIFFIYDFLTNPLPLKRTHTHAHTASWVSSRFTHLRLPFFKVWFSISLQGALLSCRSKVHINWCYFEQNKQKLVIFLFFKKLLYSFFFSLRWKRYRTLVFNLSLYISLDRFFSFFIITQLYTKHREREKPSKLVGFFFFLTQVLFLPVFLPHIYQTWGKQCYFVLILFLKADMRIFLRCRDLLLLVCLLIFWPFSRVFRPQEETHT